MDISQGTSPDGPAGRDDELSAALVAVLAGESLVGLHMVDSELRGVSFRAGRATGPGRESARRLWLARGLSDPRVERVLRGVVASGQPAYDVRCPLHTDPENPEDEGEAESAANDGNADGRAVPFGLSAAPLRTGTGGVAGVAVAVADRTADERAGRRLLLDRARAGLGDSLDIFQSAQALAEAAVPALADAVAVDVLDPVLHGDAPAPGPLTEPATVRRAGFAFVDGPGTVPLPHEVGSVRLMHHGTPYAYALADLTPRVLPVVRDDAGWVARTPERAEVFRRFGVHSMVVVPLTARGVVLGLAAFYRRRGSEPFTPQDAGLAAELAAHGALCLDNARLYTRERTVARIAQRELVPLRLPSSVAVEAAHTYLPAAAGGSWYDVIRLSGARAALVAGEVRDSGLRAVTAMGQLRTAVHAFAALDLDPAELLGRLNELAARLAVERTGPDPAPEATGPLSATCLYVVYDAVHGRCEAASAAHPPPVLAPPGAAPRVLDVEAGPELGRGAGPYRVAKHELPAGSLLALYSQGLLGGGDSDGRDGGRDGSRNGGGDGGRERLARLLAGQHGQPLRAACDDVAGGLLPPSPADDALLLLARTRVLTPGREVVAWSLPDDPHSVGLARRLAVAALDRWGLGEQAPPVELIVSELVTNAVRYGSGDITLRLLRAGTLICEVSDGNTAAPHLRIAEDTDEGGRGLCIVGLTARTWGTRQTGHGKTIWADVPLPGGPPAPEG
ncbi:ATP-binding SpoIIE family protein phosphatase [Streptomyces sp. MAR4 CNX-425]|uniref:ATP-binding SpoIIE family protein phosphatase n=1 Tax=Streptomyces sp. MAR4 CNX-425 TaxID=3406343 RepID=UPI003B50A22E